MVLSGLLATILLCVLAVFLPPVPVFIKKKCTWHFWLAILLTILGWIPGMIFALYIIFATPGV